MEFITSGNRIATENFSIGKIYTVTFTNGNYFINTCVGIGSDFVMFQQEAPKMLFCLDMESAETVSTIDESGGGSGTNNYNELNNKPSINGVTLIGNKTAADLSILPVPIVGENDNNKVLTASYSGGVGSYSWQPASGSGTTDYTELTNKPQINSVELNGNKSLADLGIASAEALAGKQDVISDLNTIRSGAAAGATAVQPATLAGYQTLIDSSHKLSSDLVDDTGHTNKFATAAQLAQIGTNTAAIAGKQDALSSSQLQAVNSGITSALVTQIGTNTSAIAGKQDTLSSSQLAAVNSGITSALVTQITTNKNNILFAYGGIIGKNVVKQNTVTFTGHNKEILCAPISGYITIYVGNCVSTDTDASTCSLMIDYVDGGSSIIIPINRGTSTVVQNINLGSHVVKDITIYSSDNYAHGAGDTATFTDIMICSHANYIADSSYQPYVMSNAEITAWILSQT